MLECLLILLPVSYISLFGGVVAVLLLIDNGAFVSIAVFLPAALLCLASLTALWSVSIHALFAWRMFSASKVRILYALMHAGALLAGAGGLLFALVLLLPSLQHGPVSALASLVFGAPALILYGHLVWLRRGRE